jgi:hypothetical protein
MSKKDSDTIWGIPTAVDTANAMNFAQQQVNALKCQDPDVIKSVCEGTGPGGYAGGGTCIQWVEEKSARTFPTPANYFLQQCSSDTDCKWGDTQMGYCDLGTKQCTCGGDKKCGQGMDCIPDPTKPSNLLCGWAPNVSAGHCIFTNETACEAQGKLPYTCDNSGYCTPRPEDSPSGPNYPYTEWNLNPSDGTHRCIVGNFLLRQWCENPGSRCEKDPSTGDYPSMCKGSETEKGVTDVPQFFYDKSKSQCYMTHDYCDVFGKSYNKNSCNTSADCQAGDTCFMDPREGRQSYCVGPGSDCSESTGQKVGEFFIGKTLFYLFNKGGCETYEHPKDFKPTIDRVTESLRKVPDQACVIADTKKVKKKILVGKDFAGPEINLYMISWENGKNFTGFLADEVEKIYPNIVNIKNGLKYICMSKEDINGDKNLKRIFYAVNSRGWMTQNIDQMVNKLFRNK